MHLHVWFNTSFAVLYWTISHYRVQDIDEHREIYAIDKQIHPVGNISSLSKPSANICYLPPILAGAVKQSWSVILEDI